MRTHTDHLSRQGRAWRLGPRAWRGQGRTGGSWISVALVAASVLLVSAVVVVCLRTSEPEPRLAEAETVPAGGDVALPLSTFGDGHARFYRYMTAKGHEVRFFVLKSGDGVVRAAFDACDSCYRKRQGFRQVGDHLICNSCGRAFSSNHVNVLKGGCSPAPLERTLEGDRVIIRTTALEQGAHYF